jgi:glutaredoxin
MASHIILYSTSTCQYCWEVREYLREQKAPFVEVDIETSDDAAREVQRLTGDLVVPVTVVRAEQREDVVIGYNRQKLAKLLE